MAELPVVWVTVSQAQQRPVLTKNRTGLNHLDVFSKGCKALVYRIHWLLKSCQVPKSFEQS
jgi:hypothetical protein